MIKNPNPPSSLGITDFGFNIPWAPVLLVLKHQLVKQKFQDLAVQQPFGSQKYSKCQTTPILILRARMPKGY